MVCIMVSRRRLMRTKCCDNLLMGRMNWKVSCWWCPSLPEFLTDVRRGLNRYEALKLRIWDEVRDRQYQNPLGALIRLSGSSNDQEAC